MIDISGSSHELGPTPIGVEGPARDGPYFLRGKRVQASGNELGGLVDVASGGLVMMKRCTSSAGPASSVRLDPGLVTRSWSDGGVERTWAALTLPLLVWEYAGPGAATLEWQVPVGVRGSVECAEPGCCWATLANDGRILFLAEGGALSATAADGLALIRFEHWGAARLVAIAAADDAGERRTRDHLRRRGIAGLASQRAQHADHLGKLGTRLRTPEADINRAFSWSSFLCEEAASRGALDSPESAFLARGLRAAGLQGVVRAADTPVTACRTVPAEGALHRLREAGSLVNARSVVMFGSDTTRAAAALEDGVNGLFGVMVDGNGVLTVMPAAPEGWRAMGLDRLRVGSAVLDVEVRQRPSATAISIRVRSGGPVTAIVGLADVSVAQVDLDDVVMPSARARFEARHDHLLVFRHAD